MCTNNICLWADPERECTEGEDPLEKQRVAIGFFGNSSTEYRPPREEIGPIVSQGRSMQQSVKYFDDFDD